MAKICQKIRVQVSIILMLALIGIVSINHLSTQAYAQAGPESLADLVEGLQDAVVNISSTQIIEENRTSPLPELPQIPEDSPFREFFDDFFDNPDDNNPRSIPRQSLGSGFVIDGEKGIVITNFHVIEGADEITVNFTNETKLKATVIGSDKKTDIAVLEVTPTEKLAEVKFGNSDEMRVGDWVVAIGNPFGLSGSVSVGIISAFNRELNSGPYDNFIQTDAAINTGNSGGPLFNVYGEVIGINTAILSPGNRNIFGSAGNIGIGFAIPSATAKSVIDQLIEFGETRRGWLGVRIQEVTEEIAEGLGMEKAIGALVAGVTEGGPAEAANFVEGDVIIRFDGKEVPIMRDLPTMVANTEIGKEVDVVVWRKGEELTLRVVLGRLEDGEKLITANSSDEDPIQTENEVVLGLTLSNLTDDLRAKHKIDADVVGVLITAVEEGSAAEEKRVGVGDVIVQVAQQEVNSPTDVLDRVEELMKNERKTALLMLSDNDGDIRFVGVRIEG